MGLLGIHHFSSVAGGEPLWWMDRLHEDASFGVDGHARTNCFVLDMTRPKRNLRGFFTFSAVIQIENLRNSAE